MFGIEFVRDAKFKEPFPQDYRVSKAYQKECLDRGFIQYACQGSVDGVTGDMMLIVPPLVITEEEIEFMLATMRAGLESLTTAYKPVRGLASPDSLLIEWNSST